MLALGLKRYVLAAEGPHDFEVVGGTEHSLGGGVVDPPAMAGRDGERRHLWTYPVAEYALDRALAEGNGEPAPTFRAPWDAPGEAPFPVLHRFSAGSPAALGQLPEHLGAHPFAPIVEARRDRYGMDPDGPTPVALDPGTDLSEWEDVEWRDDHGPLRVTTRPGRVSPYMVMLHRLADFATDWAIPVPPKHQGVVDADPRLIRRVGRGGALIDAQLADSRARAEDHIVVYDDGDPVAFVRSEVRPPRAAGVWPPLWGGPQHDEEDRRWSSSKYRHGPPGARGASCRGKKADLRLRWLR